MNDLQLCGLITLNNKLKENIIYTIQDLKQFGYNLIIISGDNEYNCISLAFKCDISGNKNIYSFDKGDNSSKIKIKKLYKTKNNKEEKKILH